MLVEAEVDGQRRGDPRRELGCVGDDVATQDDERETREETERAQEWREEADHDTPEEHERDVQHGTRPAPVRTGVLRPTKA